VVFRPGVDIKWVDEIVEDGAQVKVRGVIGAVQEQ
jgi:hypothetical protein